MWLQPTMTQAQAPVVVSSEEWAAGLLGEGKVTAVVKAVAERGLCVVENIIPDEVLDHLAARLDYDAAHQVASKHKFEERGVFGHGHLQLGLPRCAPWVKPEIVANPILEQLAVAILGPCFLGFYNGNTNTPDSTHPQPMHSDGDWVWKTAEEAASAGRPWPFRPTGIICNFGVDDITEADGTEVATPLTPEHPPAC